MTNRRSGSPLAVAAILLALVLSACSENPPTVDEWLPQWNHAVDSVHSVDPAGSGLTQEECGRLLADLRIHQADLHPTPDEAIEETVRLWVEVAESVFFDCPPAGGFSSGFAELERLEAEVEVVLDMDQTG